jgi:hypothetical protein
LQTNGSALIVKISVLPFFNCTVGKAARHGMLFLYVVINAVISRFKSKPYNSICDEKK